MSEGALRHLDGFSRRHPQLQTTLFVTADWRCLSPRPARLWLAAIPWLRNFFYLAPIRPKGSMSLARHARFSAYLRSLPQTEIAFHSLPPRLTGNDDPGRIRETQPL